MASARLTPCGRCIRRPTSAVLLSSTAEGCLMNLASMAATAVSANFCRLILSAASVEGLDDMECSTKASTWHSIALANGILHFLLSNSSDADKLSSRANAALIQVKVG